VSSPKPSIVVFVVLKGSGKDPVNLANLKGGKERLKMWWLKGVKKKNTDGGGQGWTQDELGAKLHRLVKYWSEFNPPTPSANQVSARREKVKGVKKIEPVHMGEKK